MRFINSKYRVNTIMVKSSHQTSHKTKKQKTKKQNSIHKSSKTKKHTHNKKKKEQAQKDETEFRYYQMNCGIKLIMIHNAKSTSLNISCSIAGGSSEEPEHLAGITHFLEHLVFRKTKHFKTGP